jgi:hypothetical protein
MALRQKGTVTTLPFMYIDMDFKGDVVVFLEVLSLHSLERQRKTTTNLKTDSITYIKLFILHNIYT